jgi:hypothetical protein
VSGYSTQTRSYAPAASIARVRLRAITGACVAPSTSKAGGASLSRSLCELIETSAFTKDRASSPHDGLLRDGFNCEVSFEQQTRRHALRIYLGSIQPNKKLIETALGAALIMIASPAKMEIGTWKKSSVHDRIIRNYFTYKQIDAQKAVNEHYHKKESR